MLGYRQGDAGDVYLLEAVLSDKSAGHVTGDGNHGNRVKHRRCDTRNEVCSAGAGGSDTNADLSRSAGISVCRVGCALLVRGQNVVYLVLMIVKSVVYVDDLSAGIAKNVGNALVNKGPYDYF